MADYCDISGTLPDDVKHWYICGPDRGQLIGAYQEIRQHAAQHTSHTEVLDGSKASVSEVIEYLRGAGSFEGEAPTLVVLDNAQDLDLTSLQDATTREYPSWLIAVGTEDKVVGKNPRYAYFYRRSAAKMVTCRNLSEKRQLRWVQRRLGCTADTAHAFVSRAGGDTEWLAVEMQKLAPLGYGEQIHPGHVPLITSGTANGNFVESLLLGRKGAALSSIPSKRSCAAVFRQLEELTIKGAMVYEAQKNIGWSSRVLLDRTGLSVNELAMLRGHVNVFGRTPTERRLRAMARVSTRAIRGDRTAWQTLVALW